MVSVSKLLEGIGRGKENSYEAHESFEMIDNQRIENLKKQIVTANNLLNEYEIDLILEGDPKKREKQNIEIERLKKDIYEKKEQLMVLAKKN